MYLQPEQRAANTQTPTAVNAATHDYYPSRLTQPPASLFLPRREPIGEQVSADGPLTEKQCQRFIRDGFLFEPHFLSGELLAACQAELHHLLSDPQHRGQDYAVTEPGSGAVRSLFAVHRLSSLFRQLSELPALTARVHQLLGGDSDIHQSRINYKPGFVGRGFAWHSDFETWHAEDGMPAMHAVSASIILTDNHAFNGPLMLIPGSHRQFVPCLGDTPADHYRQSLRAQRVGVPGDDAIAELVKRGGIQAPTGPAGSLLLFDCNTLHGSNANMSPDPRSNIFFVYNRRDNRCGEPFAARQRRPDFLCHR